MNTTTMLAAVCWCTLIMSCSQREPSGNRRVIDIPDSVLIHFSYSLIPVGYDGYNSATSFFDASLPITQHAGAFTSPLSKEALISVPYVSSDGPFSKLFIVKMRGTESQLVNWFHSDCTSFSVADIDHDGVDEILTENRYTDRQNILHKICEVFSLSGDSVNVLYQTYSVDGSKADYFEQHVAGDTILKWYEHTLEDPDQDSIFEIKEILRWATFEGIQSGKVRLSEASDTAIVSLEKAQERSTFTK
jgi:hypothetical protein